MKRIILFILALAVFGTACNKKAAAPDAPASVVPTTFVYNTTALPSNEIPAVANAENTGRGFVSATLRVTRDGSGTITGGKLDYGITVSSFPQTTNFTNMHIHEGNATVGSGPVRINSGLANGEVVLVNGSATITKLNNEVTAPLAQALINDPAGFYFNIHSTANPAGVARGQLVLIQSQ